MNSKYLLGLGGAILLIALVLVLLTFGQINRSGFRYDTETLLEQIKGQPHLLSPQELIEMQQGQTCKILDLREAKSFAEYSLDGATNLPLERVLSPEAAAWFDTNLPKVLVDQDGAQANMAWMLLSQCGHARLYVLEGGIDNWRTHVDVETLEKTTAFEDEKPRYDYAKVMEK